MSDQSFVPDEKLSDFLRQIPGERKVANIGSDDGPLWGNLDQVDTTDVVAGLRGARPFSPLKSVLMPVSELVARYGQAEGDPLEEIAEVTMAVIGVRGCECRALTYLDRIMLDEPMADPFYELRRNNATIVSVDCAVAADSCFCNLLDQPAYPEANFDLNLSPIDGGFLVEAGTEKGGQILTEAGALLSAAAAGQAEQRDAMRRQTAEQLAAQNAEYSFPENVAESLPATVDEGFWRQEMALCVQCGGCTAVCPQCYCFLMYDQESGQDAYERLRVWDSCQFTGYSQMAGVPGGLKPDPRRTHMSKFQHRFAHKFWYNPLMLGVLGCVGCGRCSDTCPGAIDLRRVISELNEACVKNG